MKTLDEAWKAVVDLIATRPYPGDTGGQPGGWGLQMYHYPDTPYSDRETPVHLSVHPSIDSHHRNAIFVRAKTEVEGLEALYEKIKNTPIEGQRSTGPKSDVDEASALLTAELRSKGIKVFKNMGEMVGYRLSGNQYVISIEILESNYSTDSDIPERYKGWPVKVSIIADHDKDTVIRHAGWQPEYKLVPREMAEDLPDYHDWHRKRLEVEYAEYDRQLAEAKASGTKESANS